jgi:hypothetical protein
MNGTTALGTKTMTSGIATLATTALPEGADSITVVYSGSADYLASTSSPLTQTVNAAASVAPAGSGNKR